MNLLLDYENSETASIYTLELEETLQDDRAREIDALDGLSKKVCSLHTNVLYCRHLPKVGPICLDIWNTIIKRIGGSPMAWRDLGFLLGIGKQDLDYINYSVKDDCTDVVLKVFMQSDDATLDKVIDAFIKMKRYDILKAVENPLINLVQCFEKNESKSDTGYHSSLKHDDKSQIISFEDLVINLPPVLIAKNKTSFSNKEPEHPKQQQNGTPVLSVKNVKNNNTVIMMTFAEDGDETVLDIRNKLKDWPEEFPKVSVITLNENRGEVLQKPQSFIRECFEKADYIVPILTTGYMNEIKQHTINIANNSENLDHKYVHFIYTLIANKYIHVNGCMNKNVRSVIPLDLDPNLLREIGIYPDLLPYTNMHSFDKVFQAYIKKRHI